MKKVKLNKFGRTEFDNSGTGTKCKEWDYDNSKVSQFGKILKKKWPNIDMDLSYYKYVSIKNPDFTNRKGEAAFDEKDKKVSEWFKKFCAEYGMWVYKQNKNTIRVEEGFVTPGDTHYRYEKGGKIDEEIKKQLKNISDENGRIGYYDVRDFLQDNLPDLDELELDYAMEGLEPDYSNYENEDVFVAEDVESKYEELKSSYEKGGKLDKKVINNEDDWFEVLNKREREFTNEIEGYSGIDSVYVNKMSGVVHINMMSKNKDPHLILAPPFWEGSKQLPMDLNTDDGDIVYTETIDIPKNMTYDEFTPWYATRVIVFYDKAIKNIGSSYSKGGKVRSNNNEMLIGGIAGFLLGMFIKK